MSYTGSLTAVGPFKLPPPPSGTLSRISCGTRPSVQPEVIQSFRRLHKRICSLDTSAFSALEVRYINLLTYLISYLLVSYSVCPIFLNEDQVRWSITPEVVNANARQFTGGLAHFYA